MQSLLGNKILDTSLSLYMWGKNVRTQRYIPPEKQSEYSGFVKECIKKGKDKTEKRKGLSVIDKYKDDMEKKYHDTHNKNISVPDRLKECETGFNKLKKDTKSKGRVPIWCSAALAVMGGIGRILWMPFDNVIRPHINHATKKDDEENPSSREGSSSSSPAASINTSEVAQDQDVHPRV